MEEILNFLKMLGIFLAVLCIAISVLFSTYFVLGLINGKNNVLNLSVNGKEIYSSKKLKDIRD